VKTDDATFSYPVAIGIVNKFRESDDKLSNTGYAPRDVYSIMYEEFDALGGTILVTLDEVGKIVATRRYFTIFHVHATAAT